jgi:hypothetical protein
MQRRGVLTTRFDEAVAYALAAHDTQRRKGTEIPYAAHLLGVAALVLEGGGSEDEAIAGLLHDVVEDQDPDGTRLDDIRQRFGDAVADVVLECSAEDKTDDPGWRVRKKRYLAAIDDASDSALLVSLADKVYNARSIVEDIRLHGLSMLERFGADEPKDQSILWYYRSLYGAYDAHGGGSRRLLSEFRRTVDELAQLIGNPPCPSCGSTDVWELAWGMADPRYLEESAGRKISFRGCVIEPNAPDFSCEGCGHEWINPQFADERR